MSQETPRSSAGVSTPRTYAEIFSDLDIFKEAEYQKPLSKFIQNNRIDWTHEDPARDSFCGDSRQFSEINNCVEYESKISHKIATLEEKLADESQMRNQQMKIIVEHEKNIQERLCEKNKEIENLKKEKCNTDAKCAELKEQLDITSKHLDNLETSFNDVHKKYERAKQAIQVLQKNVEILKESILEHEDCIKQKHSQFLQLKEHAIERLNYANSQLDLTERKFSLESSKLRAIINELELHTRSLSEQLDRKNRENIELNSICDGLISKMDFPDNITLKNIMTEYDGELLSFNEKN